MSVLLSYCNTDFHIRGQKAKQKDDRGRMNSALLITH